jgi:hypothetical protein
MKMPDFSITGIIDPGLKKPSGKIHTDHPFQPPSPLRSPVPSVPEMHDGLSIAPVPGVNQLEDEICERVCKEPPKPMLPRLADKFPVARIVRNIKALF